MARKRLNKNLVIGLTLFGFAVMVALSALMLHQLRMGDPRHFLDLAGRYEAEGKWKQAALFYQKASERSHDPIHLVAVGRMLLNDGEVGQALQVWRSALVDQPDLIEAHLNKIAVLLELAELYGGVPNWLNVQEAAEALLATSGARTPDQTALAHHALGAALVHLPGQAEDNAEHGVAELRAAHELVPDSVDFALDLARALIGQGLVDDGVHIYDDLLNAHEETSPESAKVRSAYAAHLAAEGQVDEAEEFFKESLALAPEASRSLHEARLEYARFLSQQWARAQRPDGNAADADPRFDKAENLLKACVAFDPDDFDPYVQWATLTKAAGHNEETIKIARSRLDRGLTRKGVKSLRHKLRAFQLMLLASDACVALSVQAVDQPGVRDEWLAKARGYVGDAKGEFLNDPRVLAQSARVLRASGQDRAALEEFRKAMEAYRARNTIDWRTTLDTARLHLLLNEPGAALSVLEAVADQAATTAFWTLYAQTLFQNDELNRAMAVADRILNKEPDNSAAKRIKAAVYDRLGHSAQAARLSDSPTLRAVLEAREHATDGDRDGAITVLRDALKTNPSDLRLVQVTVSELLAMDRSKEARAVVDAAIGADPDNTFLKKLSVLVQPDLTPAQRDRQLLDIVEAEDDPYQRAWDLIDFHARRKQLREVLDAIEVARAHLLQRDTPMARQATIAQHRALLQVALRAAAHLEDSAAMEAVRDAAVSYNVDGAHGQSIVGMYHLYRKEYELAIRAFRGALQEQPSDARTMTRLGQCLQQVDRTDEARMYFERALHINRNDPWAHRGLAVLAKQAGDQAVYETELAFCEKKMPSDSWVRAEVIARQDRANPAGAIQRREALLAEHPEDGANLARLAALYETTGDREKADGVLSQLLKLRPDDKAIVAQVAQYYRRTDRPEQSLALVTAFADSRSTPQEQAEAEVLVAAHYLARRQLDLVETTLLAAADRATTLEVAYGLGEFYLRSVSRPKQALVWFDKAVALARAADSPKLPKIMAMRIACLLHRGLHDVKTARTRADELTSAFPHDPLAYLWQSEVSAREGEIGKAIDALSEYLNTNPDAAYPRYQRAQYYLVQGRTAPAMEDLEAIKRFDPLALDGKPRLLLAKLQDQAGHRDASIRELESLAQEAPDSLKAHEVLVSAYLEDGRFDDADRTVTAQINRAGDAPDARWFFLRSQVSLQMGDYDKASADFQRAVAISEFSPESLLLVLEAHLRAGRFSEGVAFYEPYRARSRKTAALLARYAHLLAGSNRTGEAVEAFGQAMGLALTDSSTAVRDVSSELGAAFGSNEASLNEAISGIENRRKERPLTQRFGRILTRLYRMAGHTQKAADELERLIQAATPGRELADLLVEQAELFQSQGDAERARDRYDEALKYDSGNWVALNNIAYLLSDTLGHNELALPYARRAVAISDTADTLDTLGWIYVALKDYSLAVAELSRAIRMAPDTPLAYYHLGEAFRRLGRFPEAQRALEQGRELARETAPEALRNLIGAALEKVAQSDRTS